MVMLRFGHGRSLKGRESYPGLGVFRIKHEKQIAMDSVMKAVTPKCITS